MIIIKIYSQDLYVASEVSMSGAEKIATLLNIAKTDVFFVGSEGVLVAEGVEQISWFTYLEVSLSEKHRHAQQVLSELLQSIFANYGVHILIKFDYVGDNNITKVLNPEFKVFNEMIVDVMPSTYYDDEDDDDDDDEPWDDI